MLTNGKYLGIVSYNLNINQLISINSYPSFMYKCRDNNITIAIQQNNLKFVVPYTEPRSYYLITVNGVKVCQIAYTGK